MQTVKSAETYDVDRVTGGQGRTPGRKVPATSPILQTVATGTSLFRSGDERLLYRVERGAICHYIRWADGRHDVIEFAFPGDIIGLGCLGTHVSTAQAMVESVVSIITETDLNQALGTDHPLSLRLAAAGEREFDYLRDRAMHAARRGPVERLACYLVAISNMNAEEGRDPAHIPEDISSGFVADRLQMSIDSLAMALVTLQSKRLIAATAGGLHILDCHALERMAGAD